MGSKIVIDFPKIQQNTVTYQYSVEGEVSEAFHTEEPFYITYKEDISDVPVGILLVPFLANVLPVAWVYDAVIEIPVCDKSFFDSIDEFKKGYQDMYPMLDLKGQIIAKEVTENNNCKGNYGAFFSGGVDAFNTLITNIERKPLLITLWGADVKIKDVEGWKKVEAHIQSTAKQFDLEYAIIQSSFRLFLDEWKLSGKVAKSGDGWWHGFQHSIGIISHAAPIAYLHGISLLYFASSFTIEEKGKVTCASDPTIDNYIRFGETHVWHDGYEFHRHKKVHNIVSYAKKTKVKIPLRVCWESEGGSNCCICEKCFRTMFSLYVEGADPVNYGFDVTNEKLQKVSDRIRYKDYHELRRPIYQKIKAECRNIEKSSLPKSLHWFYDQDLQSVINPSKMKRLHNKINRFLKHI